MAEAIIYARFSPRPGAAESESCERQEAACRDYCGRRGYEVAGYYDDRAVSGDDADRPGLWQAIGELRRGMVLVVRWRNRLAREVYLSEVIRRSVAAAGATIEAVEESNGESPQDHLIRQILAAFSEYERKIIGLRTKYAMLRHQKAGRRMGLIPPYGWDVDPDDRKLLIQNHTEQGVIELMRTMRTSGQSYRAIARELDRLGIAPKSAKKWGAKAVFNIVNRT